MLNEIMCIQKDEFLKWVEEEPMVIAHLLEGYGATISDLSSEIRVDPRVRANDHIVNHDFLTCPRFIMGFQRLYEKKQFVLSCLYVFPAFRRQGYATKLINIAKHIVQTGGYIHVAVEKEKLSYLHDFYIRQGFISTNKTIANPIGVEYQDYFWSGRSIRLSWNNGMIIVHFE